MKIVNFNNSHLTSFKGIDASVDYTQKEKRDYINFLASYEPNLRFNSVAKNTAKAMVVVPFVDTVASFMIKKGPLASKLKSSAFSASIWIAAFSAGALVNSGGKKLANIKFFDDFSEKHPTATAVVKFVTMYGVFKSLLENAPVVKDLLVTKFPTQANLLSKKIFAPMKRILNDSVINTRIVKPLNLLADKHPVMSKNLSTAAKLAAPIILLASIFRFVNEAKNRNQNIANNLTLLHAMDELNSDTKV